VGWHGDHAARFNSPHFWQKHLEFGSPAFTVWPQFWQMNQSFHFLNIGLNSSPATQYGQRTDFSIILSLPLVRLPAPSLRFDHVVSIVNRPEQRGTFARCD
jgi:hypothetical protein